MVYLHHQIIIIRFLNLSYQLNVTRVILAEEIDEDGCYVIKRVQEHIPDRTFVVRTATTMTAKQIMAMCFNEWDLYERGYPKDLCLVGLAGDGFRKNTVLSEDWRTGDLSSDVTDADMWIVDRIIFECMYMRLKSYLH